MSISKPDNHTAHISAITPEQRRAYLDTLVFLQIDARLLNIKRAHNKTCMWLLDQGEYKNWLDPDKIHDHHGFLWVKGKPGAGKSTVMEYALARAKQEMTSSTIISFFFNARGETLENNFGNVSIIIVSAPDRNTPTSRRISAIGFCNGKSWRTRRRTLEN
jgi:hypothetical protein